MSVNPWRRRAARCVLPALAAASAALLTGQVASPQPPPASEPQDTPPVATLRVTSQVVLVDVAVVNRKTGQSVVPLSLDEVAVAEDGVPQRLLSISHAELPLSIVFLLDITDSVRPVLHSLALGRVMSSVISARATRRRCSSSARIRSGCSASPAGAISSSMHWNVRWKKPTTKPPS